jgi:antitoxin component YwqK of YwqJK toxin-antitoxin module
MSSQYHRFKLVTFFVLFEVIITAVLTIVVLSNAGKNKVTQKKYFHIRDNVIYLTNDNVPYSGRILDTLNSRIIIEYDVVNGLKHGEFFLSTIDGHYTVYGFLDKNKNVGKWQYYYESGQLECVGNFNDDAPVGKWVWYYENGSVRSEGQYLNGKPEGRWINYDSRGCINSIVTYREGKIINSVQFGSSLTV